MECKRCGRHFDRKSGNQMYCCKECRILDHKRKKPNEKREPIEKICIECGKKFKTHLSYAKYCSKMCRELHNVSSNQIDKGNKDRAFTSSTPYLCQKWNREGMPTRQIAEILNRSDENVKSALHVKLSSEAYDDMKNFSK